MMEFDTLKEKQKNVQINGAMASTDAQFPGEIGSSKIGVSNLEGNERRNLWLKRG